MFYVYMIRCEDNSLYTGYTNDIQKRMIEHFSKGQRGAKYTKSHTPVSLEAIWSCESKSSAMKMEYHLKRMTKKEKEVLINDNVASAFIVEKLLDIKIERIDTSEVVI
ncbi:MAG: GIY-YIG nuclease family protein [Ruminococcaceae bacterium]|nr:GIY-YIG nuclease family protein [Oscillospiraceae bacterium]